MDDLDPDLTEYPIDGVLDLHTFSPKEIKDLVPEYIHACLKKGIYKIRIIHGKGTGTLRTIVHSILAKHPDVESFRLDSGSSSWGATLVNLKHKRED
jgi:DNA-nicking Smr family endonuclease